MNKPITYLLGFLTALGCGAYLYGAALACVISWPIPIDSAKPINFPVFLSLIVTSIAAVLSTNLGAVLGITVTNPNSSFRETKTWNPINFFTNPSFSIIQITACYVYILSLLSAAIVWGHR